MTYDRFGESDSGPIEPGNSDPVQDEAALAEHKARCSGWIDRDADHPVPCLQCKPHLAPDVRRRHLGLGGKK